MCCVTCVRGGAFLHNIAWLVPFPVKFKEMLLLQKGRIFPMELNARHFFL
jgi:hypothetical protein